MAHRKRRVVRRRPSRRRVSRRRISDGGIGDRRPVRRGVRRVASRLQGFGWKRELIGGAMAGAGGAGYALGVPLTQKLISSRLIAGGLTALAEWIVAVMFLGDDSAGKGAIGAYAADMMVYFDVPAKLGLNDYFNDYFSDSEIGPRNTVYLPIPSRNVVRMGDRSTVAGHNYVRMGDNATAYGEGYGHGYGS